MMRLVHPDLPPAWDRDLREGAPADLADGRALHALLLELRDGRLHVVAHEVELVVLGTAVRRMDAELGRREGEDEPPLPRVDRAEAEDVLEEGADLVRVLRVDECVDSVDHAAMLTSLSRP
jgi:hypothetical protein